MVMDNIFPSPGLPGMVISHQAEQACLSDGSSRGPLHMTLEGMTKLMTFAFCNVFSLVWVNSTRHGFNTLTSRVNPLGPFMLLQMAKFSFFFMTES